MQARNFTFLAFAFLIGCDQPNLPRRAVVYDREITPLVQTKIHGKQIIESFDAQVIGITDGDTIQGSHHGE